MTADASAVLAALYGELTGEPVDPAAVRMHGAESVLPGAFRVPAAAAACVGATTLAAAELLRQRGGAPGQCTVDIRHAAEAFRSERHLRVDGAPPQDVWAELSGDYPARDGWVKLHCNYPQHAAAAAAALGVDQDRRQFTEAVAARDAVDVAEAVLAHGGAAAAMRTRAEWLAGAQAAAVRAEPLVDLRRIGDAPAEPLSDADRPLSGVRVLDLTHVIAGPVCGRTLAAHGATVLHVGARHLPTVPPLVVDTGFGKSSVWLDLRTAADRARLAALVADADVLVQSFRPGSLAARGFGAAELAALRPGIVLIELCAYGWTGPWAPRRGFDSLVQMASGIAAEYATDKPCPLPAQALDHGTGWLAAAAAITALHRRAVSGGSWRARLSLARTGEWLHSLGRGAGGAATPVDDLLATMPSDFGELRYVRPPGELPGAPPRWSCPPPLPGSGTPRWE